MLFFFFVSSVLPLHLVLAVERQKVRVDTVDLCVTRASLSCVSVPLCSQDRGSEEGEIDDKKK